MTKLGNWIGQTLGGAIIDVIGWERAERICLPLLNRLQAWIDRHPRFSAWLENREENR